MRLIITLAFLLVFTTIEAQNVGVNKPNPNQPLDVNGNVNIDGKLLVNGTSGKDGEVLTTNASGATTWANFCDFKFVRNYTQNSSFTVPAGVTRIMVEAWGAGGGGSEGGGGAAGMYIQSVQDVTPGSVITLTIGVGGNKAGGTGTPGSDGTQTLVTGIAPFTTFGALGGKGAFAISPANPVRLGTFGNFFTQYGGEAGYGNSFTYAQKNATTYTIIRKYGDGGAAGPDYRIRSQGETRIINEATLATLEINYTAFAAFPAGGGGGGVQAKDGSGGMVNIRY